MKNFMSRIKSDEGALGTVEILFIIGFVVVLVIYVFSAITNSAKDNTSKTTQCIADPSKCALPKV